MNSSQTILYIVFIPVLGAFLLPLAGQFSCRLRNFLACLFIFLPCILSLTLIKPVMGGANPAFLLRLPLGFDLAFCADALAVFMACVSSLVSALIVFYSLGYISHYQYQNEYYCMVVLFLGAMMGLVFSANLILLYVFWEITAITSWRLIGFFRQKSYVLAADKAFLVTAFGAILMLLGFLSIYQQTGSFDLGVIKQAMKSGGLPALSFWLILAGILSKSATLPFQTWLPDAGVAPSPVTALLHAAVLVKIGVYVFARLFLVTFGITPVAQNWVTLIAAASALVSAGAALRETDLKRLIAYSTISQIGFIFFALSLNTPIAFSAGLLYILMHGLAKAGLFLCAGIVEQNTRTKDITKLGGLFYTMPVTALAFLFCALSVMGLPPFGGFWSKYLLFSGAMQAGKIIPGLVFLTGAVLTILYLMRAFNLVFMGQPHGSQAKEGSATMVFSVAALGMLSLAAGFLVSYPLTLAHLAAGLLSRGVLR